MVSQGGLPLNDGEASPHSRPKARAGLCISGAPLFYPPNAKLCLRLAKASYAFQLHAFNRRLDCGGFRTPYTAQLTYSIILRILAI